MQKPMINTVHALKIWIKPVRSVYARFSCHALYSLLLLCSMFVHVTEDLGILEHQRTRIWHFRKQKTGDFTLFTLTHVCDCEPVCSFKNICYNF